MCVFATDGWGRDEVLVNSSIPEFFAASSGAKYLHFDDFCLFNSHMPLDLDDLCPAAESCLHFLSPL